MSLLLSQEDIDQPDLRPQGEIEEVVTRRDREAPIGRYHYLTLDNSLYKSMLESLPSGT